MAVQIKTYDANVADLIPTTKNPRQISKKDFENLKKSLHDFPEMKSIREVVIDENKRILGGHQRVKALQAIGETQVPVKQIFGLTEEQKDEFIIKDNVSNGEWDMDILANEWDADQLSEWGVEVPTHQDIIEDEPADIDNKETFSIVGEIYQLGEHRVFCGSFEDSEKMRQLFGDKKATCTFTDPPYNVAYQGGTKDKLTIKNDSMSHEDFLDFLTRACSTMKQNTVIGGYSGLDE